jgi:hypothetical protein
VRDKQSRSRNVALLRLLLTVPLLLALGGLLPPAALAESVPKAECGPNDRVETGLQGQTTVAERESGLSALGFNCNLELVGQFEGEGASYGFAWFDDCAYYGTANTSQQQHPGVVVVDASDPRHPQATAYLDDPAMLEPWESLKVNKKRQLLGGNKGPGGGAGDHFFSFYDISDCGHPKLLSVLDVPDHRGHGGDFAPDGMTYYGMSLQNPGHLTAVDIADPTNPKVLAISRQFLFHDVTISDDGTRMYAAQPGNSAARPGPNGLVIVDVSDIQFRRPNPQIRVIGTLFWEDGSTAQVPLPVTYRGRPYLIFTDERGAGGSGLAAKQAACAQGLPPHGFARIIDISDETNPQIVSKLMLEVNDPANCAAVLNDPDRYSYSSHYCNVDATVNPTMLACSWREGALRVFDISDPVHPREIAYYKPPARRTAFRPGSIFWRDTGGGDRTNDQTPSNVRFRKHRGEQGEKDRGELWFTSQDNGFQIVRFTNGVGSPRCFDPGPRGCAANE